MDLARPTLNGRGGKRMSGRPVAAGEGWASEAQRNFGWWWNCCVSWLWSWWCLSEFREFTLKIVNLKIVDFTICKLRFVVVFFFLRVGKDFLGNFCFSCNMKGELGVSEIKVVGKRHCRQRKWWASSWQCLGMEVQSSGSRGRGASRELRHEVWGQHARQAVRLLWLCCWHPRVARSHCRLCVLAKSSSGWYRQGWTCTDKPLRDYYRCWGKGGPDILGKWL